MHPTFMDCKIDSGVWYRNCGSGLTVAKIKVFLGIVREIKWKIAKLISLT